MYDTGEYNNADIALSPVDHPSAFTIGKVPCESYSVSYYSLPSPCVGISPPENTSSFDPGLGVSLDTGQTIFASVRVWLNIGETVSSHIKDELESEGS